jgi:GR25 family glycosyltransferase involved in LPS biosynthesis
MEGFPFYIINLDRCPDRWLDMESHYDKTTLHRISAYDGNKLKSYDDIILPTFSSHITAYELACSLSHLNAIKTAYENNEREAFFLEDDVINTYKDDWDKSIKELVNEKPSNCECLTFFNINFNLTKIMISLSNTYTPYNGSHWSAGCYYLNRRGMRKIYRRYIKKGKIDLTLLKNGERNDIVADHDLIFKQVETYHITKPTFIDKCETSTIHSQHLIVHRKNNEMIHEYFLEKKHS